MLSSCTRAQSAGASREFACVLGAWLRLPSSLTSLDVQESSMLIQWLVPSTSTTSKSSSAGQTPPSNPTTFPPRPLRPKEAHSVDFLFFRPKCHSVSWRIFFRQSRWGGLTAPSQKGANRIPRLPGRRSALCLEYSIRQLSQRGKSNSMSAAEGPRVSRITSLALYRYWRSRRSVDDTVLYTPNSKDAGIVGENRIP
jgi:hypothetical protein